MSQRLSKINETFLREMVVFKNGWNNLSKVETTKSDLVQGEGGGIG